MKGDKKVIELLNAHLKNELTAINQYFLHAKILKNWGMEKLASYEHKESIDEMKHADKIIERILFLEGLPNLQDQGRLKIGETVEEILKSDLALELDVLPLLKSAVAHCESVSDYVSRQLFADILASEEGHVDFLETQLGLIERMGLQNYVQLQTPSAE